MIEHMRKVSFADMNCSIAQALEIVGEWWTLLILRDCFLGVRRFDDFVDRLGSSRNVLTDRLDKLVAADVLGDIGGPDAAAAYHGRKRGSSAEWRHRERSVRLAARGGQEGPGARACVAAG